MGHKNSYSLKTFNWHQATRGPSATVFLSLLYVVSPTQHGCGLGLLTSDQQLDALVTQRDGHRGQTVLLISASLANGDVNEPVINPRSVRRSNQRPATANTAGIIHSTRQ